jgi:putative pyruvate formate lyase activating enzyme
VSRSLYFAEEPPISGTRSSGTIFFARYNLRCVYCQNHQINQEFAEGLTRVLITTEGLASDMLPVEDEGTHNINFVSPSHMIFQMAFAIEAARARGVAIPVVYNSNGYNSVDALRRIRGLVDIYLLDVKYMENALGKRSSRSGEKQNAGGQSIASNPPFLLVS